MQRKEFLKKTSLAALGGSLLIQSCKSEDTSSIDAPNIITSKKYKWKLVTTWPPNFPVLGEGMHTICALQWLCHSCTMHTLARVG